MKKALLLISILYAMTACSPKIERLGYKEPRPTTKKMDVKVFRNRTDLVLSNRVGRMKINGGSFTTNCSEDDIIAIIKQEACGLRATYVNIYDIVSERASESGCFEASVDYYKGEVPTELNKQTGNNAIAGGATAETNKYFSADSNSASRVSSQSSENSPGFHTVDYYQKKKMGETNPTELIGTILYAKFGLEFITSGNQRLLDQTTTVPDYYSKRNIGVGLSYFFNNSIGMEFGYDFYASTIASKSNYEPMELFTESFTRLGISCNIYQNKTYDKMYYLNLCGGANYCSTTFSDDVINSNPGMTTSSATGTGYYLHPEFGYINRDHFALSFGIGYESFSPKFKDYSEVLSAECISLFIKLGYKF